MGETAVSDLSITTLLTKYKERKPKAYGDFMERQYPVSAVIDIIREAKEYSDYWKQRCILAERFIEESPGDPDVTKSQTEAFKAYNDFIASNKLHTL